MTVGVPQIQFLGEGMVGISGLGAWFDSGYMVCVSSWVLVPYCFLFYTKENWDPEVVSVLLPGVLVCESRCVEQCAQSILQLPSEFVVACGTWTLRP